MSVTAILASANDLLASHAALVSRARETQKTRRRELRSLPSPPQSVLRLPLIPSPEPSPPSSLPGSPTLASSQPKFIRSDLPPAKRARSARYDNYVPEEETIRNDYSQRYVDGGEWPQNWVLGADPEHRFEEYPKQQRLLSLKKTSVSAHALPPSYISFAELSTLNPSKFDVILIDPPFSSAFTWDDLQELPVPSLAADPSFVLLWVGSGAGEGLERGRQVLAKWGFRRCEDIVWIKTNHDSNRGPGTDPPTTSLLTRTKQHCLMGIRGTVRRSTDSWFVHCNVDTDVMISAPSLTDPTLKPEETYTLIENFCLGLRRLELFGRARTLRRGWVTVLAEGEESRIGETTIHEQLDADGDQLMPVKWNKESWEAKIKELAAQSSGGKIVVPTTAEIDSLRPKSPVRNSSATPQQLTTMLPTNPGVSSTVSMPTPRGPNAPASGRVMMGPPVSVASLPTAAFEGGVINPILNWTDMSNMNSMQATPMNVNVNARVQQQQQQAPRLGFANQGNFVGGAGGGFEQHVWNSQGQGTWDETGVFIGNNLGMSGVGMGVPDMSMGGMGMQGHGMGGGGVGMGMAQNMANMGAMAHMTPAAMGMQNAVGMAAAMGGMGRGNMRTMGAMANMGMNNLGMTNMGNMAAMGMNGMNNMGMGGMNMGHWPGS